MKLIALLCLTAGICAGERVRAESPPDGGVLSLPDVVGLVLSNNPSLKAARANWEAMRERVPQARAWEDAQAGVDSEVARFVAVPANSFSDQRFFLSQALPLSGRNRFRGDAAGAEAVNAYAGFLRRQLDLTRQARVAYFRLADAYAQLDLNQKNAGLWKELADTTRDKYRTGTQSEADVLSAETELAKLEETGSDFQRQISEGKIELNRLMNRPGLTPVARPSVPGLAPAVFSLGALEGLVLVHRPELWMAEEKVAAAQARYNVARREWIPDPSLRLGAERYNDASQAISELDLGLSVNLPWFNRAKYKAEVRETQELLRGAQYELESARLAALTAVEDQLVKVETYHHHTELFQAKLLPLARQAVTARQQGYETDKANFLELLTAQISQQEIESMYWDHFFDYQIALAELESIIGAPPPSEPTTLDHHH